MNKKPGLLFAVCLLAMIILANVFDMNLGADAPVKLRQGVDPNNVLYICPITKNAWTSFASSLSMVKKYVWGGFVFAFIILAFNWGWALYQNMVKDKFNEKAYSGPWGFTKIYFWAAVICFILFTTPNHFRTVHFHQNGRVFNAVLCENNSAHATAVSPKAVTLH